jgi:hypothetical protein
VPWGGITTYPTFSGPRYSLYQFRNLISQALKRKAGVSKKYGILVKKECNPETSKSNLKEAIEALLKTPLQKPREMQTAEKEGKLKLFRYADPKIAQAFLEKKEVIPEGALVDGTGLDTKTFPYRRFQQVVQGFYTTVDQTPTVKKGDRFRGFFRTTLWKEEQALVEFGFPGPRIKRYKDKEWETLISCVKWEKPSDIMLFPRNKEEIRLTQELVDLGYLVPDFY